MRRCNKTIPWSSVFMLALPALLVALTGCPFFSPTLVDTDGDGVPDILDTCPESPTGGDVDDNGCAASQRDSDGDGVTDDQDQCADTPTTVNVDEAGCPVSEPGTPDTDEDGVPDDIDQCPDTPAGEPVDPNGCSARQLDADLDGVPNDIDECADTPSTVDVDDVGCPVSEPGTPDTDGDGVPDDIDQCPGTPAGQAVDPNGCAGSQLDRDNDGVTDDVDQCDDTPAGASVDGDGCAASQRDGDGDGVTDDLDQCGATPVGAAVDANGCAASQRDTDDDGVTDDLDQCANTPAGAVVDEDGCGPTQRDTDGDGVSDADDECPNTPAGTNVDSTGCEEEPPDPPAETDTSWQVNNDVLFVGVLDPDIYNLGANGVLKDARVDFEDPATVTILTNTAPLGQFTELATTVVQDVGNGDVEIVFGVRFDQFVVDFESDGSVNGCNADGVCWVFDITISTESDLTDATSVSTTRLKGVQSGTLSGDGKTVTWNSISGTRTLRTALDGDTLEIEIDALGVVLQGTSLGTWTLIE